MKDCEQMENNMDAECIFLPVEIVEKDYGEMEKEYNDSDKRIKMKMELMPF